jgi:hypothetical protein
VPVLPPGGLDRTHGMAGITPAAVMQAVGDADHAASYG